MRKIILSHNKLSFCSRRFSWINILQYSAFALIIIGMKLWLISFYGNATPFWDQWDAEAANLYTPFLNHTLRFVDLFSLHNEHRIFTTRILALTLLLLNGTWNPLMQMVVNAALHIGVLLLIVITLIRAIGRRYLTVLLVFSSILFGLPYAWGNTLAGFQSQFYFVVLFSVASLWYTVTENPFTLRWWCGAVFGILAFLSLASGVFAFAAAAIIGLLFYVMGLRKTNKQVLAVAILALMFTLGVLLTPTLAKYASLSQFFDALLAILGWPISTNFFSAFIRNLPALVFVVVMLKNRPPVSSCKWFLLALVVWSFGQQAVSIAYGRAVGNLSSRYLDLFAIGILVNFACLISIGQININNQRCRTIFAVSLWTIVVLVSLGLTQK